jgi:hypothetical protein
VWEANKAGKKKGEEGLGKKRGGFSAEMDWKTLTESVR